MNKLDLPSDISKPSPRRNSERMPSDHRHRSRSRSSHSGTTQQRGSRYKALNNDVTEHELINSFNNNDDSSINARYVPREKKPPLITVCNISIMDLRNKLSLVKNIDQQKLLIRLTQHGTKIFCQNSHEFNILKQFCTKNNIYYYTHTLYDERRIKVCLYGLYKMNIDTLKNELLTTHKVRPIDIKIIDPNVQKRRYSEECIYILYFQKKDNVRIESLRQITGLFNIKVNWKYYSSKSHGPTQCSNCQDFGHGTENCFLKPKSQFFKVPPYSFTNIR